jgi:Nif-specific regulatory protein
MQEEPELVQLRRERDFFERLLALTSKGAVAGFVEEALRLIVELAGAEQGYLQLDVVPDAEEPTWFASGFSTVEIDDVRSSISSGVIARALSSGETIDSASALLDERFRDRESVRRKRISAVLCVPIGEQARLGVLYLQRQREPGPFGSRDRAHAELFARLLAPLAQNLEWRQRAERSSDATAALREKLRAETIVGRSPAVAALLREVSMVAPVSVNVLLTGESGTGKSHVARVIHDNGPRRAGPFVELNCATLPADLVESELFGALPGAHSTARTRIIGKVAAAEGGTLFLDEISELTPGAQGKLLQLLQSRTYYPLGSSREERADIRVIAASNVDLVAAMSAGKFREDLYYRLQVLPVRVPSLAERAEDVPLLAEHFRARAVERNRTPHLQFSPETLRALRGLEWPGNVRQLENVVEAAVIRAAGDNATEIGVRHLTPASALAVAAGEQRPGDGTETFQEATRLFQMRMVGRMLEETGWNVSETARRLDLTRTHIYNLIERFGLERDKD